MIMILWIPVKDELRIIYDMYITFSQRELAVF